MTTFSPAGFVQPERRWVQVLQPAGTTAFDALLPALADNAESLSRTLIHHGGLLLRGFGVDSAARFERVAGVFLARQQDYLGGISRRGRVLNNVYNTTDAPPHVVVAQHLEAMHTPDPPGRILFNCQRAPSAGGETPLSNFVELFEKLPAALMEPLRDERVVYTRQLIDRESRMYRTLPGILTKSLALSWQEAVGTEDYEAAAGRLEAAGYEVTRYANRCLGTRCSQPLISPHPASGRPRWYLSDQNTRPMPFFWRWSRKLLRRWVSIEFFLESGRPLPQALLDQVHDTIQGLQFSFAWQPGDVLVLDNEQMAHGRNSFRGERLILTAFG